MPAHFGSTHNIPSSKHSDPPSSSDRVPGSTQLPTCLQYYLLYVLVPIQVTCNGNPQVFGRKASWYSLSIVCI